MAEGIFPKVSGSPAYPSEFNTVNYANIEAGENLTAGNVVYIKKNDGEAYVSDTGTADDIRADGIVVSSVTTGNTAKVILRGNYTTSGLTAKEIYYLGTTGAISTTVSAVQVGIATSTTNLFVGIVQDDSSPIGTIKHVLANITGVPTNNISAFWILADGTTISDAESPLNGQAVPDLNGSNLFLRSADTAGGTGGSASTAYLGRTTGETNAAANTINTIGGTVSGSIVTEPPYINAVAIIKIK